jgi:hypothetical protein
MSIMLTRRDDAKMKSLNKAFFLFLLSTLPFATSSQSARQERSKDDPVLGDRIAEGVVFAARLWLRGTVVRSGDASGALVSVSLADLSRRDDFDSGVLGMKTIGGDLWVLRQPPSSKMEWILSVLRNEAFEDRAHFVSQDIDLPIALFNSGGTPAVLSHTSIRTLSEDGRWSSVRLEGQLRRGVQIQVASPVNGNSAYVGINMGEWGGGLQRVDLKTGKVSSIERRDTKDLCGGPLNSDCDPVTGVIPDLQNKDCVLVAIGLVHFLSHGRILRVCDTKVSVVFEHSEKKEINGKSLEVSAAFYGLASTDGGFWAITPGALYRFAVDGNTQVRYPLPKMKPVSGVYMNRDLPGVIVVRTDVNWAVSLSGYTPLIVPLDEPKP